MWVPSRSDCFFLPRSRQRLRFSLTSRMPTVICVGRSDRIGTGCTLGSRALVVMVEGPLIWLRLVVQGSGVCHGHSGGKIRSRAPRSQADVHGPERHQFLAVVAAQSL